MARLGRGQPFPQRLRGVGSGTFINDGGSVSVDLSGTILTATESDIVAGGETIILTVTGDTWVAAGATFDAERQNILNGLFSPTDEAFSWNFNQSGLAVTDVVRTSNTVVTITLTALAAYAITISETITSTVPGSALVLGNPVVAAPDFTITNEGAAVTYPGWYSSAGGWY